MIPLDTAVLALQTDGQQFFSDLDKAEQRALGLGKAFEQTQRSEKSLIDSTRALESALDDVFGKRLEERARAVSTGIMQLGDVSKLSGAEVKRFLADIDAYISKAARLGKEVPPHILQSRDALAKVNVEGNKTPGILQSVGSSAMKMAGALGLAFSAASVLNFTKDVFAAAGQIDDLSKKLEVSAQAAQRWKHAAEQGGTTIDTVGTAVAKMNQVLGAGEKSTIANLKLVGLSFDEVRRMKPEDAFETIGDAIAKIEDPATRARVAVGLFGRSGQDLLPMFIDGIRQVGDSITHMSDDTVARLAAAEDAWGRLGTAITIHTGETIALGLAVIEGAIAAVDRLTSSWKKFAQTMEIIAAGSMTGFKGLTDALRLIKALDDAESGKGGGKGKTEEERRREIQASIEAALKLGEETAAEGRLKRAREERAELERRIAAAKVPLTAAQRTEIQNLLRLGLAESDIAKYLRVSEIRVKAYADEWQNLERIRAQVIPRIKANTQDLIDALPLDPFNPGGLKVSDQLSLIPQTPLESLRNAQLVDFMQREWASVMGDDGTVARMAIADAKRLGTDVGEAMANNWGDALDSIAGAFARVGNGLVATMANTFQRIARLWDTNFKDMSTSQKVSNIAQGVADLYAGTGQGSTTQRTVVGVGSGAATGAMVGSIVPGVGTVAGGVIGGIAGGLIGFFRGRAANAESKKVNDARDQFLSQFGFSGTGPGSGFANLAAQLHDVGPLGDQLFQKLLNARRVEDFERAMAAVNMVLADAQQRLQKFNDGLGDHLTRIRDLGGGLPDSIVEYLNGLREANKLTEGNIALLEELAGGGAVKWQQIEEAANRYGVSQDKLGQSFHALKLHDAWQQLIDDIDLFERGNQDVNALLPEMADEISALVQQSRKFGTEIPENMRKWIERLAESGQLLDENGEKITDLSGLTFGESLQTSLQRLIDSVYKLIEAFSQVPGAAAAAANAATGAFEVPGGGGEVDLPQPDLAARGGFVTPRGVSYLDRGGWLPRGTDTVPAMLTPGEFVVNRRAVDLVGADVLHALNAGRGLAARAASSIEGIVQHITVMLERTPFLREMRRGMPRDMVLQGNWG